MSGKLAPLPSICEKYKVSNAFDWYNSARPAILKLLAENEYGFIPPCPASMKIELWRERHGLVDGAAYRREFRVTLANNGRRHKFDVLVYSPEKPGNKPLTAIASLNFKGNAGVALEDDVLPLDAVHNAQPGRWPIKQLVKDNIMLVTAARNDFYYDDPTPKSRRNSIFRLFGEVDGGDRHYTALSAWAFGFRTLCDLILTLPEVDPKRIWLHGHSRLGKTALWAAANDPRVAGVVSNDSGCGGAAISRDKEGETLKAIIDKFPHWFVPEFDKYKDNEKALPWDQHFLVALSAPRPVLVASASEDQWAHPFNEFRAAVAAGEVYKLFGIHGIEEGTPFPKPEAPILRRGVGYYLRTGKHGVVPYDWKQVADFIRLNG